MADLALSTRRSRWPLILGGLLLVFVFLYFVISSGPFVRTFILPVVSRQMSSEITVESIDLSPFSSLRLKGVKVVPDGREPLATVGEIYVRYGLWSILTGKIQVHELTVDSPSFTVVQKPGAPSNLETVLKGLQSDDSASKQSASKTSTVLQIQNVAIRHGAFTSTVIGTNGSGSALRLSGLELSVDSVANGSPGKLKLGFDASVTNATAGRLDIGTRGEFDFSLGRALEPLSAKGSIHSEVTAAEGGSQLAKGLVADLALDATATVLNQLSLDFKRGSAAVGKVSFSGPCDLDKKDVRISYEIRGIGREVMSVIGTVIGHDLGETSLSGSGRVDWAQYGNLLASNGRMDVSRLTVATPGGTTPALDIGLDYKISVNLSDSTALFEKVNLTVVQGGRSFLSGSLDRPMNIAWKGKGPGFRTATYKLAVDGFDLASWQSVVSGLVPGLQLSSGLVKLDLSATSDNDAHSLKFEFASAISKLSVASGSTRLDNGLVKLGLSCTWEEFTSLQFDKFNFEVVQADGRLCQLNGVAHYHSANKEIGVQIGGDLDVLRALKISPIPNVQLERGSATISLQLTQRPEGVEGSLAVALVKLKGQVGSVQLTDYQLQVDGSAKLSKSTLTVSRIIVALQNGFDSGGSFDVNGSYDLDTQAGRFNFKSVNLNQIGLGPFVAPAIAPNKLISIGLDLNGSASLDPKRGDSVQGTVKVTNFRADDTAHLLPDRPLALEANLDLSQIGSVTEVKKLSLLLGQTARARNELAMVGHFDLSKTNATPSYLTAKSDGLDLTALYYLFFQPNASTNVAAAKNPGATSAGSSRDPNVEPPAIPLPLQHFDLDLNFARVFLGEIAISNWVAKMKLDKGAVTVDPFSLVLNGAPVSARAAVDLTVPGYRYDIGFEGNRVPLAPAINTFQPSRAGTLSGTAVAKAAFKGAGITGPSLQRNLEGQFDLLATNMNLKIGNVQGGILKGILNMVVGLPDLIRSPGSALTKLTQATGINSGKTEPGKADGWIDQLQAEPLQFLRVQGKVGTGTVTVSDASVQSSVLRVRAPGTISLAPVLTNSALDFAVDVGLKDTLGKKIGLSAAPGDFASLPPGCLAIRGTLGKPEPKPDVSKLVLLGGKALLGVAGNTGAAIGDLLQQATGGTNSTSTNALIQDLKSIGGLFNSKPITNAAGKTNTQPSGFNPLDLLNGSGSPKK